MTHSHSPSISPSTSPIRLARLTSLFVAATALSTLAACGGGGSTAAATPPAPAPAPAGAPVAQALVVTSASPAAINGTLDQATVGIESGESNELDTTYLASSTFCRVAAYGVKSSGDGKEYVITVTFAKAGGAIGIIKFTDNTANFIPTYIARAAGPTVAGLSIDTTARVISFADVRFGAAGSNTVVLNGTLAYPTNAVVANRTACG